MKNLLEQYKEIIELLQKNKYLPQVISNEGLTTNTNHIDNNFTEGKIYNKNIYLFQRQLMSNHFLIVNNKLYFIPYDPLNTDAEHTKQGKSKDSFVLDATRYVLIADIETRIVLDSRFSFLFPAEETKEEITIIENLQQCEYAYFTNNRNQLMKGELVGNVKRTVDNIEQIIFYVFRTKEKEEIEIPAYRCFFSLEDAIEI